MEKEITNERNSTNGDNEEHDAMSITQSISHFKFKNARKRCKQMAKELKKNEDL